jgi:CelD/BcsL family acetyltransferase involved in cellulose biosynthesis
MRSEQGVKAIEVRSELPREGFATRPAGVIHTLELKADPAATMRSFRRSHVKRNIAAAERQGVTVREARTIDDLAGHFYRLHLGTRRRQGSPIQPRRFFRLLWQRIVETGLGFCLLAELGGETIAGAVFLAWNRTLTYKYGASDQSYLQARPNHLIFWRAIERASERGLDWLDFGRSEVEQTGLREFKSSWGAVELPLVYSSVGEAPPAGRSGILLDAMGLVVRHSPPFVCRALGEAFYRYAV